MNMCHQFTHAAPSPEGIMKALTDITQGSQISAQKSQVSRKVGGRRKGKANTTKYHYNWNKIQHRKYINFLIKHRELFDLTNEERKCVKINVIMGKAIKTRTAAQCHSHHQKMMIKFATIEGIIKAHLHLITKKLVPKKYIALIKDLQDEKRSEERQTQPPEEPEEEMKESSHPYWLELANFDGFYNYSSFPEEASSFF